MRVLLANRPRSYHEAFASAFQELRPQIEVSIAGPVVLDREVLRVRPDLVVCDRVTPAVRAIANSWVEIRIEDEVMVVNSSSGAWPADKRVELKDLLALVDQVATPVQRNTDQADNP